MRGPAGRHAGTGPARGQQPGGTLLVVPRTGMGRVAAGLLVAFTALALLVRRARQVPGDGALARLSSGAGPDALALAVDRLTGYAATCTLTGLAVLLLAWRGRRRDAVLCALSVTGTLVGTTLLKQLVGRPRPELLSPSVEVSSLSFPSGHAAGTAALVVTLVLTVRSTRARRCAAVAGALAVLGAAAAQLALTLHHASDVVGGWLFAAGWTTAVWATSGGRRDR